jgi:glycosyltransferase involved in cell wall biosynthesis
MKISIIIPAYNEQSRIEKTVRTYHSFFTQKSSDHFFFELIIVLNGCVDNTRAIVNDIQKDLGNDTIIIVETPYAGKGLAIALGFATAVKRTENTLIGFVDADMATLPEAFFDLIENINNYDGAIASRYMPESHITPARPLYKRWGSRIIYEPLVYFLFGLSYYDLQCGAKLFKHHVIAKILPHLTEKQWAFDVELLYLCKKFNFIVKEFPTVWHDQADSKLTLKGGMGMLSALVKVWKKHKDQKYS